jgi:HEAT repeat protein
MSMPQRILRAALLAAPLVALLPPAAAPARAGFDWIGKIELDAEGLRSGDPRTRLIAITALASYDIEITRPHLLKALADDEDSVRQEAARVLGRQRVDEAVPYLISWHDDPDAKTKQVAADALADIATEEAIDALVRSLGDSDPLVRLRATSALGRVATPAVVIPLISRLEDDKPEVRRAAIEQLQEIRDPRAVIPIVGAFGDGSLDVRKAAITAIGKLGDTAAVPALLRQLKESQEDLRALAVASLGNLGAADATDLLIGELESGSDVYRAKVAYALGQIGKRDDSGAAGDKALRALVEALSTPSLSTAAREALRAAGERAVAPLVAHLEGKIDGDPASAVALLRDIADADATPALVIELERGRVPTSLVLEALGAAGDSRALVPVLGLLDDDDDAVRLEAMMALRPLLAGDPRGADVLIERLSDVELEIRVLAAEYLGLMRSTRAVPKLVGLATPGNKPRLRAASIDALGEIGDARAIDVLLDLLEEGPAELQGRAANALIYIADQGSVKRLLALAEDERTASRHQVVRALGGVLRGTKNATARALLTRAASRGTLSVSLAAIGALAAMRDTEAVPTLVELATASNPDRRRAALTALGDLRDARGLPALRDALDAGDDRVAGDAAWALAKFGDADSLDLLVRAARKGGWATAINATAALALHATAKQEDELLKLIHHKSRFVQINAAWGLGRLGAADAKKPLEEILLRSTSIEVRKAAARALGQITRAGGSESGASAALDLAARSDRDDAVREAAAAALHGDTGVVPRDDWRNFYFVDPGSDDAPVRQEPYFVIAADGIVDALYTDARGESAEEWFPSGEYLIAPKTQESAY